MDENRARILRLAAADMGIRLDEKQIDLFNRYHGEIGVWNKKINLLSRSSTEDTFLKNCLDSLSVIPFLPHRGCSILDMGSGGGFPGIPLKIAVDTLNVSLLEASRKKTSFLNHVIRALSLSGIRVIHERVENIQRDGAYAGLFEAVISKAAFKLPQFIAMGAPLLSPGGALIAMKGVRMDEEMKDAELSASDYGMRLSSIHTIKLPHTGEERRILIYDFSSSDVGGKN